MVTKSKCRYKQIKIFVSPVYRKFTASLHVTELGSFFLPALEQTRPSAIFFCARDISRLNHVFFELRRYHRGSSRPFSNPRLEQAVLKSKLEVTMLAASFKLP